MARNRPTAAELIDAVSDFLAVEVEPELNSPDVQYRLRVACNVLNITAREHRSIEEHERRERKTLQALLGESSTDLMQLNEQLCERLRKGDFDERFDELLPTLTQITLDKLSIDNPRYSTYKHLLKS